ncbi:hypothetical protein GCM10010409_48510 [Mycolicibacterium diernhoferi]
MANTSDLASALSSITSVTVRGTARAEAGGRLSVSASVMAGKSDRPPRARGVALPVDGTDSDDRRIG